MLRTVTVKYHLVMLGHNCMWRIITFTDGLANRPYVCALSLHQLVVQLLEGSTTDCKSNTEKLQAYWSTVAYINTKQISNIRNIKSPVCTPDTIKSKAFISSLFWDSVCVLFGAGQVVYSMDNVYVSTMNVCWLDMWQLTLKVNLCSFKQKQGA